MPIKRKTRRQGQRPTHKQLLARKRNRCPFHKDGVKTIDYKDTATLKKYISADGKIIPVRLTNISALMQRKLAVAIKRARYLSLLPYTDQHSL